MIINREFSKILTTFPISKFKVEVKNRDFLLSKTQFSNFQKHLTLMNCGIYLGYSMKGG